MARAIYTVADGKVVADFDPAIAAQMKSLDLEAPLPDLWPQFEAFQNIPLMVIRGENSKLLTTATLKEMARRHPGMTTKIAGGQRTRSDSAPWGCSDCNPGFPVRRFEFHASPKAAVQKRKGPVGKTGPILF